ncbi:LuxR C-terminal-related transcriptional regulator [Vibrio sp. SCSIO 43137]|uniref:LuxR C-terminal-related transcriptional regulator n=1 Tax=Vibrio sp. SCSIO 43137 TaxID=3021011 RepID=UPI002307EB98|nr:LuxR C-terminal-related transcriptional regulator [Vibrio sp. SCSIO 43137]WCE32039.1 LuxR C-terminal-related transcriptional regulator [Vibrio sp. SCSIO 43137]
MERQLKLQALLLKTVTDIELWQDVLGQIATITGARKGIIMLRNKSTSDLYISKDIHFDLQSPMLYGLSNEEVGSYITHFYKVDPWTEIENKHHPVAPYAMSSYLPIDELEKTEFWQWLEPQGISDTVVVELHSSVDSWISLNMFFDGRDEKVKQATLELLRNMQDIFTQVWEFGMQHRATTASPESLNFFLEQQELPSLLVDGHSKVVKANEKAEQLLAESSFPISNKDGYLFIKDRAELNKLREGIAALSKSESQPAALPTCDIKINGYNCLCTLLGEGEDVIGADTVLRMLSIKPEKTVTVNGMCLIWESEGLTRREKELVEVLANGGRVVDFMNQYNLAKSTSHIHWGNVKKKLNVKDRNEIYAYHKLYLETIN